MPDLPAAGAARERRGNRRRVLVARHAARPSSSASRPSSRSDGLREQPLAGAVDQPQPALGSKAKTATSISSITVRSSAVASSAPSRCARSVSASALTSSSTSPSGSSRRARARGSRSRPRAARRAGSTASAAGGRRARAARARRPARARRRAASSVHGDLRGVVAGPEQDRARRATPGSAGAERQQQRCGGRASASVERRETHGAWCAGRWRLVGRMPAEQPGPS